MTYSQKLKDPRWQKKRLEILNRDNFTCTCCKDTETELHIHHIEYNGQPWEQDSDKLVTLCKYCHQAITYLGIDARNVLFSFITKTVIFEDQLTMAMYDAYEDLLHILNFYRETVNKSFIVTGDFISESYKRMQ